MRYVVLGILDGLITSMVLSARALLGISEMDYPTAMAIVAVASGINALVGFTAEYAHSRAEMAEIEEKLGARRGALARSAVHVSALRDALVSAARYGATSVVGAAIPLLPTILAGPMAGLASAYTAVVLLSLALSHITGGLPVTWVALLVLVTSVGLALGVAFPIID